MNDRIKSYAEFISKQLEREQSVLGEAAKVGKMREVDGIETHVIHNDSNGNHLHMTAHAEESGAVAFHGKIDGHRIKFESEGVHGGNPNTKDVKDDLKHQHPDLPKMVHDKVHKIAIAGMKKHGLDIPGN